MNFLKNKLYANLDNNKITRAIYEKLLRIVITSTFEKANSHPYNTKLLVNISNAIELKNILL
jgi:hypothetical protein